MALDVFLARLGPARVARWMCADEDTFRTARRRELALLNAIEASISAQQRSTVLLGPPLVPFRDPDADDAPPLEHLALPVGGSEGLCPIQKIACDILPSAVHLIRHSPDSGLFIPLTFSTPFEVESGGELVSVGSLPLLEAEIEALLPLVMPSMGISGYNAVMLAQLQNLLSMTRIAKERSLAMELA